MFCKKCGKEMSDNAKFCPGCGSAQEASEITPVPQVNVNPVMLKTKTPYYWIAKACLVLLFCCFFFEFLSGNNVEKLFKSTSYSGFELFSKSSVDEELLFLWGIIGSAAIAVLLSKIQRIFEFIGVAIAIIFVVLLKSSEGEMNVKAFNLCNYEIGMGVYLVIIFFVLAFIFATADKHVVKAQKKLEKLQESMTNTNQYQQL